MKTLVCLVALACAVAAMPQQGAPATGTAKADPAPTTGSQGASPSANQLPPQFYGPGLNNPHALSPNPQLIQVAKTVVAANPSVRVRVLTDGTVEFTNEFGQEVEVHNRLGLNVLQPVDPEEAFEIEQEQREREFEFQQRRAKIQRQQAALASLSARLDQGTGGGRGAAPAQQFSIAA